MLDQINAPAAIAFYALYVVGIVIFAVSPALQSESWRTALIYGSLFGFFAYGTYNMTNLATLRGWPMSMVAVDMLWGTAISGASAALGFAVTRHFV